MGKEITKPKLLFVEGRDEVHFFTKLAADLGLSDDIQIEELGGKAKPSAGIDAWMTAPGHEIITSVGVIIDADGDPSAAFQSVCRALEEVGLPRPTAVEQAVSDGNHQVVVMILPDGVKEGMLEDLCLESVADDPAMLCVDEYFECLEGRLETFPRNPSKARVRAFLTSKELLEEAHFEHLQRDLSELLPEFPDAPSVAKVHAFLASRYKPNLDLGIAAEAGYWPFDHPSFERVRDFLSTL